MIFEQNSFPLDCDKNVMKMLETEKCSDRRSHFHHNFVTMSQQLEIYQDSFCGENVSDKKIISKLKLLTCISSHFYKNVMKM